MHTKTNRREFLRNTTLAAGGFWVAGSIRAAESRSPNEKLNIGIIGVERRGRVSLEMVTQHQGSENIVALCDVDESRLAEAAKKHPRAKTYVDWRKMLDQKDLDAVTIGTPDQIHALASVWAMQRDISVYCEKPLAHSVHEARVVRETYNQHKDKVATQMGTQIHASENFRRVVEVIQSGAIGPVREVHAWCGRHGPGGGLPEGEQPVPQNFHWDLWLGPAPSRPYNNCYREGNLTWNRWWDFGNGTLGDMGSHVIDLPFWALNLRQPTTVEAKGDPAVASPYTNPHWLICTWEHPAIADRPPVKLTWYDGSQRPESPKGFDLNQWNWVGLLFKGERGMVLSDFKRHFLLPEADFKDFQRPQPQIPKSPGHWAEWLHACKTGEPTSCNFDYSGMLVEHNLLANVAYRAGNKLQWDPQNLKATNCPEADKYIRREYREGWTLSPPAS